jgi:hypothetical protein
MNSDQVPSVTPSNSNVLPLSGNSNDELSDGIDLHQILARLFRGLAPTLGFVALGSALGALIFLVASPTTSVTTSMRVFFAFEGFGKSEYPDHSKFQPDDLRAPDVIAEALKRLGLDTTDDMQTKVQGALNIEGLIPPNVVKERDRLRAAGQTPYTYIPDEYLITLTLPRNAPLDRQQRERLLTEIVSAYQEKFQRTYAEVPLAFGDAFESLHRADFYEYELILNVEIQNIIAFLNQELDRAKSFRSPTTNLSFNDLITQTKLFAQIRLYETLGIIRENGLSRDRGIALVKMDYFLRTLEDQEQKAIEEEKVVDGLLAKSQDRAQNYVLGIKSQATQQRSETPILDQGLIDSLLANDSSNYLVRQALEAGLKVKRIQAEKAQLLERRKDMEAFINRSPENQSALFAQVQKSLNDLELSYNELIINIRKTSADFARQQFANAVRVSMQPVTEGKYRPIALASAVGGFVGLSLGVGLSLVGIYIGERTTGASGR